MDYIYHDNLESQRLLTRKLTLKDIAAWTDFFADDEAVEFNPNINNVSNHERATIWIEKQLGRYKEKRFGLQALISKKSNEFVGQCGLISQEVDGITETEVGYHIFKKHWGNGYAPEAARLFIDYAFKNNLTDSVISIIHVNNLKSQRVADKNGLIREKETVWNDKPVFIYRINKFDWNYV